MRDQGGLHWFTDHPWARDKYKKAQPSNINRYATRLYDLLLPSLIVVQANGSLLGAISPNKGEHGHREEDKGHNAA